MPHGQDRMRAAVPLLRRAALAFAVLVVATAVVVGIATGVFAAAGRRALYATGVYVDSGSSTIAPGFFDTPTAPTPTVTPKGPITPVLPDLTATARADGATIVKRLAGLPHKDIGHVSYIVADGRTGATLARVAPSRPVLPASTLKLFTAAAALHTLGPDHTFTTSVVAAPTAASPSAASPSESGAATTTIVLVGGGDPYLEQAQPGGAFPHTATLAELAQRTAAALQQRNVTTVRLGYDATLFSGPAWNPTWPKEYRDQVTPTSALWVGEGRLAGGSPGPRTTNPPQQAAAAFAGLLRTHHLHVAVAGSIPVTDHGAVPRTAEVLASVESMPLAQIVQQVLLHSDNDGAEVLFRQVAIATGSTGTIAHARTAVQTALHRLGVWSGGIVMHDGSGLSRADRVEVSATAKVLHLAVSAQHPQLRALAVGLPVAGSDGSLRYRFFAPGTSAALGEVHAKTGTLKHVDALAGYTVTADHELLVFVLVLNDAANDYLARAWLDRAAATLTACGC